jgi:CRP/FNR family transcriptional regulator, cyclic AMP receptor protein
MAERLPRESEPLPLALAIPPDRVVVRQGEPAGALWIVVSGALVATAVSAEGRELALDVLGPGDVVGEPDGGISPVTVRSILPSGLRPPGADDATLRLAERARRTTIAALDLACSDVATRVRHRLDDLTERFGVPTGSGNRIGLPLTQEHLAALTGSTRESVNRALRSMERRTAQAPAPS